MATTSEQIVELDLGVWPDAGVSGAVVVETEYSSFLTFRATRPIDKRSPQDDGGIEDAGTALVTFRRCLLSRFGHPNDEARWGMPRFRRVSYGIYEIRNSSWITELVRENRFSFPDTREDYVSKHYLFAFHDSTFECLADDMTLELFDESYDKVFARVTQCILLEADG